MSRADEIENQPPIGTVTMRGDFVVMVEVGGLNYDVIMITIPDPAQRD